MTNYVHDLMSPSELFIAAELALLRMCVKRGVSGLCRYYDIHNAIRHAFRVGYRAGEQWLKENLPSIEPGLVTSREERAYTLALGYLTRVDQEMLGDLDKSYWIQGFEERVIDYCQQRHDDKACFLPKLQDTTKE